MKSDPKRLGLYQRDLLETRLHEQTLQGDFQAFRKLHALRKLWRASDETKKQTNTFDGK